MDHLPSERWTAASLPGRVAALALEEPAWASVAAMAGAIGLGLIMVGLQRGGPALVEIADPLLGLGCALGALGAGAILVAAPGRATGADAAPPAPDCVLAIVDAAPRAHALTSALAGRPALLAIIGPASHWPGATPHRRTLEEIIALGRAVDGLDPGMWSECLGALRSRDPALRAGGRQLDHARCAALLQGAGMRPEALARALAHHLHPALAQGPG